MLAGWIWTCTLASLPLFKISDFRKFAICLPFEVEDIASKSKFDLNIYYCTNNFCESVNWFFEIWFIDIRLIRLETLS